jgi:hypothetical protein
MHTKKFKLLQDVYFQKNEIEFPIETYIVSTMQHRKDNVYLIAGIAHVVREDQLLKIKKNQQTII